MSENKGMHPQILSLIRLKDEGRQALMKGDYAKNLEINYLIQVEMQSKDRDSELFDNVKKERKILEGFKYNGGSKNWVKSKKRQYEEWWESTIQRLYDKGYLSNEKYGFHDPAKGRQSQ